MKKFLLLFLLIYSSIVAEAPRQIETIFLPEILIEAKSYDREIFDAALEFGADTLTARLVVAQARFESGDYRNSLTIHHNNVFSMQHPRKRETTSLCACATAENRPNMYASYSSLRDAVRDLFFLLKARNIKTVQPSSQRYVKALKKKHFFEDEEIKYRTGLKASMKKVKV